MNAVYDFDNIINSDENEIICFVETMTDINKGNEDKLKSLIKNSRFSNKYEILNVPNNIFLKNIIMCLVYSSINPFLSTSPIMKQYREKIAKVCELLGLNIENVKPLCEIESDLINALETKMALADK